MGYYVNNTGKMLIGAVAALGVAKIFEKFSGGEEVEENTFGLPRLIFDELSRLARNGNGAAFTSRLDSLGAPNDSKFRRDLWDVLGGK